MYVCAYLSINVKLSSYWYERWAKEGIATLLLNRKLQNLHGHLYPCLLEKGKQLIPNFYS